MAPKKTVQKIVTEETAPAFTITVKIDNAVYTGTGETALQALQAVPTPSLDLISTGTVTVTHGDKTKELLFPGMQLKRLLNPYNQAVLVNDLVAGM